MKLTKALAVTSAGLLLSACGGESGDSSDARLTAESVASMNQLVERTDQILDALDTLNNSARRVPFLARLNVGEEESLVVNGDLSVVAACVSEPSEQPRREALAISEPGSSSGYLELYYVSSVAGSLLEQTGSYMTAEERYLVADTSSISNVDIDEGSAISAAGDAISINGETTLLSAGSQGSDCLVAGIAHVMSGTAAPEFTIPSSESEGPGDELPPPPPPGFEL